MTNQFIRSVSKWDQSKLQHDEQLLHLPFRQGNDSMKYDTFQLRSQNIY